MTRQLLEAMLFEGLLTCRKSADGITDQLIIELQIASKSFKLKGCLGGFDRIHITADSLSNSAISLELLLQQLPASGLAITRLTHELRQTIKLSAWNQQNLLTPLNRRYLSFNDLEQAITEGHPYHPCFRARSGFTLEDHQQFGPEAGQSFQVHWLAVRRDCLKSNFPVNEDKFWQQEIGVRDWQLLCGRLVLLGGDPTQHALMPIHPWQWKTLQHTMLESLLEKGQLIYLGAAGPLYRASQSVRTLIPVESAKAAHLKLPLNMVNTSSLRTLEPHAVCTAPVISVWLQHIVEQDDYLNQIQPLLILQEYAGMLLVTDKAELQGQVAAIWRDNVLTHLHTGEAAVPFTALLVNEADGRPFIDDWIQQYGLQRWLRQLFKTSVLPVWHLLIQHGIAIEAHAQNLILLHQNGWPTRIAARDFHESIEYVDDFLRNPEWAPDFTSLDDCYQQAEPNQYYWMENVEALRELFVDTLFVFNLAELANLLLQHYQFDEIRFWQMLQTEIKHYHLDQNTDPTRLARLNLEQKTINTESLLTRKLHLHSTAESHHLINNPFYSSETTTESVIHDVYQ
ncbi:IucA/IucC family siderophore biosynthesis protein [Methylophaga sp.]|uniref:IucA/IucC family protein n=1 Tax=Methylophaga sp. TaxID=2024840 RepID=UPI00272712FC|nr:IucA/IucC family protein [Methylophaga sp.]MDO8825407.1 IucA/IucC family protein [Methylophaga sp.]